jgi:hypothetical protein
MRKGSRADTLTEVVSLLFNASDSPGAFVVLSTLSVNSDAICTLLTDDEDDESGTADAATTASIEVELRKLQVLTVSSNSDRASVSSSAMPILPNSSFTVSVQFLVSFAFFISFVSSVKYRPGYHCYQSFNPRTNSTNRLTGQFQ